MKYKTAITMLLATNFTTAASAPHLRPRQSRNNYPTRCNGAALPFEAIFDLLRAKIPALPQNQHVNTATGKRIAKSCIADDEGHHVDDKNYQWCAYVTLYKLDVEYDACSRVAVEDALGEIWGICGESGGSALARDGTGGVVVHLSDGWV